MPDATVATHRRLGLGDVLGVGGLGGAASQRYRWRMPNISTVLVRVFVSDLDAAIPLATIPLHEELAQASAEKFSFRDVELARVGPFLLLAGGTAAYRDRMAASQVASLARYSPPLRRQGVRSSRGPPQVQTAQG